MAQGVLLREDVEVIWERLQEGDSGCSIAKDFAIAQQTVSAINTGKIWNSVTGLQEPPDPTRNKHRSKLTEEDVRLIDMELALGVSVSALAARYDVTYSSISQIKAGKTWAHVTGRNQD